MSRILEQDFSQFLAIDDTYSLLLTITEIELPNVLR